MTQLIIEIILLTVFIGAVYYTALYFADRKDIKELREDRLNLMEENIQLKKKLARFEATAKFRITNKEC